VTDNSLTASLNIDVADGHRLEILTPTPLESLEHIHDHFCTAEALLEIHVPNGGDVFRSSCLAQTVHRRIGKPDA
jgi:hypothetical protein